MLIRCRQNYTFFPILNKPLASTSYSLDISQERLPNCMYVCMDIVWVASCYLIISNIYAFLYLICLMSSIINC